MTIQGNITLTLIIIIAMINIYFILVSILLYATYLCTMMLFALRYVIFIQWQAYFTCFTLLYFIDCMRCGMVDIVIITMTIFFLKIIIIIIVVVCIISVILLYCESIRLVF